MKQRVTVLIADDERHIREALADLVNSQESLELVGEVDSADRAIDVAAEVKPDVAVLDVRMSGGGGPAAARGIRKVSPATRILALSAYSDHGPVIEMLRAGAVGYLVKGTAVDKVLNAIAAAARGDAIFSDEVTHGIAKELVQQIERHSEAVADIDRRRERIRDALAGGEPSMVFQPIVDLRTGRPWGYEALARFAAQPVRTPDVWFAEAHEVGLGLDLELAALAKALNHLADLPTELFLAVNVSASTELSPRLAELLMPYDGSRLVLEMTEHSVVNDYGALHSALADLRAISVRISVDDAGAGFASMRHILRLLPDFIKLDMSLTSGIDADLAKRALARGLISFAQEMGIKVVAEGIENEAELIVLRELGAHLGQGYHLGRPALLPRAAK